MKELSEQLYMTRRDFIKLAVGVCAAASGGCLDWNGVKESYNKWSNRNNRPPITPIPTLSPEQMRQQEWIERYNKAYGANLTLADLPLPAERAVHQLKMYEGMREGVDFVEPEIGDGKAYYNKSNFPREYPGFEKVVRSALVLLKEKDYLNYVYVCKNSKRIEYSGTGMSGVTDGKYILINSGVLNGFVLSMDNLDPNIPGLYEPSSISAAGVMLHEATHLELHPLIDNGIIIQNPYEDPLGKYGSEILAFRSEGEFYKALGIGIDVDKFVKENIESYKSRIERKKKVGINLSTQNN